MSDTRPLIVDSHLDLGANAIQINRDLLQPAATVRIHDAEPVMRSFGSCTVTFPELRRGKVGIIFGTVMSRLDPNDNWTRTGMWCQAQCHGVGRGHLAYYQALEREGVLQFIRNTEDLENVVTTWENPAADTPLGLVLAMESADPILDPDQVPEWYDLGLRMVSISHYGVSAYSHGTGTEGGLLPRAKLLLDAFKEAGIIVDLTHTTDQAFWEALDNYTGPVLASHNNCRALVPHQRQFTDEQLKAIIERDGVVGAALDAWMLYPDWVRGETDPSVLTLASVADHIDHVCQLAGSTRHAAIGSDLDGGYGTEQTPGDLDTIADLQELDGLLRAKGYKTEDIEAVFHGNWLRFFREVWS